MAPKQAIGSTGSSCPDLAKISNSTAPVSRKVLLMNQMAFPQIVMGVNGNKLG